MSYDARCWRVEGQQLDLLDNKPVLIITHKKSGEQRHIHPGELREDVAAVQIYDAGYLHGYSDGTAGRPINPGGCGSIAELSSEERSQMCDCKPELVLGG